MKRHQRKADRVRTGETHRVTEPKKKWQERNEARKEQGNGKGNLSRTLQGTA